MTSDSLKKIYIHTSDSLIDRFIEPINIVMQKYEINTMLRQAAFIAQIGHESGELRYKEEIASGKAYDTGKLAIALGNTPEADGDGQRFKGRGLIQLTGKNNYLAFAKDHDMSLEKTIEYLKTDLGATESAGWFWNKKNLNYLADLQQFTKITKRINGGINGLKDRQRLYTLAKGVLQNGKT